MSPNRTDAPVTQIPKTQRLVLTTLVCAAVFIVCIYLNLEAPLYSRGFGTNELNMARSACTVQSIVSTWGENPPKDFCAPAAKGTATDTSSGSDLKDLEQAGLEREIVVPRAQMSYHVDFVMIGVYLTSLLLATWMLRGFMPRWLAWALCVLTIVAAACDVSENFGSLHNIDAALAAQPDRIRLIWVFTLVKLVCFGAAFGALVLIGLLRGGSWKKNVPVLLQAAYFLRVPMLVQFFLMGLAYMDATSAGFAKMSRGIFDVPGWKATMLVSMLCFLVAWSAMILVRIILAYGEERFSGSETSLVDSGVYLPSLSVAGEMHWSTLFLYSLPAWFPIARMIGVAEAGTSRWMKLPSVVGGGVLALALLIVIDLLRLHERAEDGRDAHDFALPFKQSPKLMALRDRMLGDQPWIGNAKRFRDFVANLGPGFTDPKTHIVGSGHILALCAAIVTLAVYAASYWLHEGTWLEHRFPPVVFWFVLIVIASVLWVGSFLTFWLDYYRVPLLIAVFILATALGFIRKDDHFIETGARTAASQKRVGPEDVVSTWLEKHKGDSSPMVVVTSAGGGIQAAGWTEMVLTSLEQDTAQCSAKFRPSVVLMSSVSGGSVGVMYYADSYRQFPNVDALDSGVAGRMVEKSERSSLAAVGWGIAYPDALPLRPFVLMVDDTLDRASSMQEAWGKEWDGASHTLADWRKSVANGEQPAVVLNSTVIETGQRFELTNADPYPPVPMGTASTGDAALSFGSEMPDCDVSLLTATRLSATFPWVSPVARTEPKSCGKEYSYHFADGGYYDNFGVDSAVDWLSKANLDAAKMGKHKLIWVQIIAFPDDPPPAAKNWGWLDQATAPVNGMMDVRTTSQKENARQLRDGYLGRFGAGGGKAYQLVFQGKNAPLSWHLMASQKQDIADTWQWYVHNGDSDLNSLEKEFCGETKAGTSSPVQGEAASE